MISKNQIKFIKSLNARKFRQKYNIFIAEGDKVVQEFLRTLTFQIEALYATENWIEKNSHLLQSCPIEPSIITEKEMKQISFLTTPSEVSLLLKKAEQDLKYFKKVDEFVLVLDGVQDPGNVGTIIRIADWYGISTIYGTLETADFYHPKVVQASMGSTCHVDLLRIDDDTLYELLDTAPSYGLHLDGDLITSDTFTQSSGIIVLGNEGKGIRDQINHRLNTKIFIPGHLDRGAESLNVAVTAGIICDRLFNLKL